MKVIGKFKRISVLLSLLYLLIPLLSYAAMNDYCITPPFVVGGIKPNLLLMIDNSSSMYDLSYVDQGKYTGTCTGGDACSDSQSCPSGETCGNKNFTRNPYYCYDETFKSTKTYVGYFDAVDPDTKNTLYYQYDLTNNYFYNVASLPSICPAGSAKAIPGSLFMCVNGNRVTLFAGSGNYLNWLVASKFDVEKQVLTGGKYVSKVCSIAPDTACTTVSDCPYSGETCDADPRNVRFLQGETRGCVGRPYLKEALTGDFVNYASPETNNTNTSLGITFGIKGPENPYNATALSPGGQTYIDIYWGDYNQGNCQHAIDLLQDPNSNKQSIVDAIDVCLLNNAATNQKTCEMDHTVTCNSDTDCITTAGTCQIVNNGVCTFNNDGTCSVATGGVCTSNDGTCQGHGSNKTCVGGGKAGASCNNDNDCKYKGCTVGKVGNTCNVNADCDVETCSAGRVGNSCVFNSDCNTASCTAPVIKIGLSCTSSSDCNDSACTAPPPNVGLHCTSNWDCSITKGHCLAPVTSQIKSTFTQSMNSCYQYNRKDQDISSNEIQQVSNPSGCNQIYKDYMICNGGANDGKTCTLIGTNTAECPGGACINGPNAIRQGSPVLLCSSSYAGYCAGSNDNWQTTTWYAREYANSDECIKAKYRQYCGDVDVPPVVDPTDSASQTDQYANLPAIIADMGLESQLTKLEPTLKVQNKKDTAPTGLLQSFSDLIRFGAMGFNYNGSPSECSTAVPLPAGEVPCPKKCSNYTNISCSSRLDCPSAASDPTVTCIATTVNTDNFDGGMVTAYIGDPGVCSVTNTTPCSKDLDCSSGEKCIRVGDHDHGLVNAVDKIKAASWTPFAEAFYDATGYLARSNPYTESPAKSRTDLRLNASDFVEDKNPSQYECQANNVLLVTDGMSTTDRQTTVSSMAGIYPVPQGAVTCSPYKGSNYIEDMAWIAKNRDIKTLNSAAASPAPASLKKSEYIKTYVVFTGASNGQVGECNSETLMLNTAANGGTSLKRAEDPSSLRDALNQSFQDIASGASSGTAASVLASGEGSGATLVQALFFPSRTFGSTEIKWTGSLQNFWYYVDPRLGNSTIREETNNTTPPYILNLKDDNIIHFRFDDPNTLADLYSDPLGNGVAGPLQSTKCLDETLAGTVCSALPLGYLWEAGKNLYYRTDARTIYTTKTDAYNSQFQLTAPVSDAALQSLLQAADLNEASAIVNYVSGKDVSVCSITHKDCTTTTCSGGDGTCTPYRNRSVIFKTGDSLRPWKLGDIINSTPKLTSSIPLNLYHKMYLDKTYDKFINSSSYKSRGMVFVGANDGMLHAFNLGALTLVNDNTSVKAKLGGTTDSLGKEAWAFIPKNTLPYLKYMAQTDYTHLYYVDATPYIFDASIGGNADSLKPDDGSTWKTVLIGGMRYGGASKDACTNDINGDSVIDGRDCVLTPSPGSGFSSYFALDITDPTNPLLMWEKSAADLPGLGFTTSGPAVVRINGKTGGKPDPKTNGNWYVVFASGPSGPIDQSAHQFKGYSDQELKIYILDLRDGSLKQTIPTGLQNAFAGLLVNAAIDFDQNDPSKSGYYSDDALYFGYTQAEVSDLTTAKWTKGGVLRLVTNESRPEDTAWLVSTVVDDSVDSNIGPVTAAVTKLQNYDTHKVLLYFGTGRYFYKIGEQIDDDGSSGVRRTLYGVVDPCYKNYPSIGSYGFDAGCNDKAGVTCLLGNVNCGSLGDVTTDSTNAGSGGWYINMDLCTNLSGIELASCADPNVTFKAERMVTDPLATPMGVVFFTTTKPTADVCEYGGRTHFWAVQYDTGGAVKKGILRGRALIQVSTGSIEERDLGTAFTEKKDLGATPGATVDYRRTDMIEGVPPAGSPPGILSPPKPMNKVVHIKER